MKKRYQEIEPEVNKASEPIPVYEVHSSVQLPQQTVPISEGVKSKTMDLETMRAKLHQMVREVYSRP